MHKRRDTTSDEKKALLLAYDALPKLWQRDAAARLGISQSALVSLLKNREDIMSREGDRKRARTGKDPLVEKAVVTWIKTVRDKNANLSGPLVMEKAQEFAIKLNKADSKPTDGWFSRFKKREGIVHKKLHGECLSADVPSRDKWIEAWPSIREAFSDDNIWNADEKSYLELLLQISLRRYLCLMPSI